MCCNESARDGSDSRMRGAAACSCIIHLHLRGLTAKQKPAFGEERRSADRAAARRRWSLRLLEMMDEFLALAYARERSLPVVIARLFTPLARARPSIRNGPAPVHRRGQSGQPLKSTTTGGKRAVFCYVLIPWKPWCGCRILPPRAAGCLTWRDGGNQHRRDLPVRSRKCWIGFAD